MIASPAPSTKGIAAQSRRALDLFARVKGEWPETALAHRPPAGRTSCWPLKSAGRDWLLVQPWREYPAHAATDLGETTITECPGPGMPRGSLADTFLSLTCHPAPSAGSNGGVMVRPVGGALRSSPTIEDQMIRNAEIAALEQMPDIDRQVLTAAATAQNFAEVGKVLGFTGKHAERRGKAALAAAAKNAHDLILAA